jgi:hypothetical protein
MPLKFAPFAPLKGVITNCPFCTVTVTFGLFDVGVVVNVPGVKFGPVVPPSKFSLGVGVGVGFGTAVAVKLVT